MLESYERMPLGSNSLFPMCFLTWTGSAHCVGGAPPPPWSSRPPGYPLRQVINDTTHFIYPFHKIIDQCLIVLLMSFMLRPWLEADIWQQTADHLTVPVQLVFDCGTEIIIFLISTIYYLHLICFSFSNPLSRGGMVDKYWYWKLLLLLNLHGIVRVLKTEWDIVEVLVGHGALWDIVNTVFVGMESLLRSWNNFGN